MKDGFIALMHEFGAIMFGLAVGTVAHFGRKMMVDEKVTRRQVFAFLMQLGVIGLVASVSTRKLGMTDADLRALATAILAIGAQEVIQTLKRNGVARMTAAIIPPIAPDTEEGKPQ